MWRTRAVVSMLIAEVAGVVPDDDSDSLPDNDPDQPVPGRGTALESDLSILDRALRRGRWIVLLDWAAILVLFLSRDRSELFLELGRSGRAIFTLAVLAVAVHSGFRLGQIHVQRQVRRVCMELDGR